jgi:DNA-binding response OmpR family regulator
MGVIWVVEQSHDLGVLNRIEGAFATRRIASVESLSKLLSMTAKTELPTLILLSDVRNDDEILVKTVMHKLAHLKSELSVLVLSTCQHQVIHSSLKAYDLSYLDVSGLDDWILCQSIKSFLKLSKANHPYQRDELLHKNGVKFFELGDSKINMLSGAIHQDGVIKETLSPKEVQILCVLYQNMERCVDRSEIASLVWPGLKVSSRTLDSHISRLRSKICDVSHLVVESVYGVGYRLRNE